MRAAPARHSFNSVVSRAASGAVCSNTPQPTNRIKIADETIFLIICPLAYKSDQCSSDTHPRILTRKHQSQRLHDDEKDPTPQERWMESPVLDRVERNTRQ